MTCIDKHEDKLLKREIKLLKTEKVIRQAFHFEIFVACLLTVFILIVDPIWSVINNNAMATGLIIVYVASIIMAYVHYIKTKWIESIKRYKSIIELSSQKKQDDLPQSANNGKN